MHVARDGAIWKKLALALGDGLAFGVGVNLSNNAAARITPARPEMGTLADRLNGIEQRIEKARHNNTLPGAFQQKMVEAVVSVVDARLREQALQLDKRVTGEIAALRAEMGQQIAANRQDATAENHALQHRMTELNRQFAATVARLVDEQIAEQIAAMELRPVPVDDRVQPIQDEVADLRQRVGDNDRDTLDLVMAIGQLCLQTAERLAGAGVQQAPETTPVELVEQLQADPPQTDTPKPLWRVPLVSSFFFVTGGLLLVHYL